MACPSEVGAILRVVKDFSKNSKAVRRKAVQGVLRHIRAKQLGLITDREKLYNGDLILPVSRAASHPLDALYDTREPC